MESDRIEKVESLKRICHDAFEKYPNSCSHAVWHVISQYVPDQQYMVANDLIDFLSTERLWQEVPLGEVSGLAGEGFIVVGGLKQEEHGHVIIVFPGPEKGNGGYQYPDKKTGEIRQSRTTGMYPLALSTAMGAWPGAKSDGDKTVRDPWSPADFRMVRFWKYTGQMNRAVHRPQQTSQRWNPVVGVKVAKPLSNSDLRWRLETDALRIRQETPTNLIRWQK